MSLIQNGHLMVLEMDVSRQIRVVIALTISQSTGGREHGRLVLLEQVLIVHGGGNWWDSLIALTPIFAHYTILNHELASLRVRTLAKSVCMLSIASNELSVAFI